MDSRHAENGVDGNIFSKAERDDDRGAVSEGVGCMVMDYGGETVAKFRFETFLFGARNCAIEMKGLKWISVVILDIFGDNMGMVRHDPLMKAKVAGIHSGTRIDMAEEDDWRFCVGGWGAKTNCDSG